MSSLLFSHLLVRLFIFEDLIFKCMILILINYNNDNNDDCNIDNDHNDDGE